MDKMDNIDNQDSTDLQIDLDYLDQTDPFGFLPTAEPIFFLDTCAFNLNTSYQPSSRTSLESLDLIQEDRARLDILTRRLETRTNWLIIPEVIQEITLQSKSLLHLIEYSSAPQNKKTVVSKLLQSRKNLLKLLNEPGRNATHPDVCSGELLEQYKQFEQLARQRFKGKTNPELGTDIKLIAVALTYAQGVPTAIYTRDRQLIETFGTLAHEHSLPETYIIDELKKEVISAPKLAKTIQIGNDAHKDQFQISSA